MQKVNKGQTHNYCILARERRKTQNFIIAINLLYILLLFWIKDFIKINKRRKTRHIRTKYTIYIE